MHIAITGFPRFKRICSRHVEILLIFFSIYLIRDCNVGNVILIETIDFLTFDPLSEEEKAIYIRE